MLVSAAAALAPLTILVLAWDEATPTVRAVIEATTTVAPLVDSVLVMVPQGEAPEELRADEHPSLPPTPEPADARPPVPAPAPPPAQAAAPAPEVPAAPAPVLAAVASDAPGVVASLPVALPPSPAAEPLAAPALPAAPTGGYAAVRILRLGRLSLPELGRRAGQPLPAPTWTGTPSQPAAPYLGATAAVPSGQPLPALGSPAPMSSHEPDTLPAVEELALAEELPHPAASPQPPTPALALPLADLRYEPAEALAPALAADLLRVQLPVAVELAEITPLSPAPLATPEAATALPASFGYEQAGWPEALATLGQVLPLATSPPVPAELLTPAGDLAQATELAALRPAVAQYSAPDLNFQVIQYARFAVPVALAEAPFEVIFAPAWPTWLAAQELRQRTGRPLVLHVAALPTPQAPLDTATGWVAELQRQALRRADVVLVETTALAQRLYLELALPAGRVQVVPAAEAGAIAQALRAAQLPPPRSQG